MLVFSQALGFQTCLLSGSLTLVVMNLPTIIRTTQESLKTVPQGYREVVSYTHLYGVGDVCSFHAGGNEGQRFHGGSAPRYRYHPYVSGAGRYRQL